MPAPTPPQYAAPLRRRADITKWLRSRAAWRTRGGADYDCKGWLFCFNVKLPPLDWSFERLLEVYRTHCCVEAFDPLWVNGCRAVWDEEPDEARRDGLYEAAAHACRAVFVGDDGGGKPDDDGWNQLYEGDPVDVRFAFMGRSGGWLVLTRFEGWELTCDEHGDYDDAVRGMDFRTLRKLYRYVVMLAADLETKKIVDELEFQAAYTFFDHFCCDVNSPEKDKAARVTTGRLNAAFCDEHIERPQRRVEVTKKPPAADEPPEVRRRLIGR